MNINAPWPSCPSYYVTLGRRQPWFALINWAAVHSKSLKAPIMPRGLGQNCDDDQPTPGAVADRMQTN